MSYRYLFVRRKKLQSGDMRLPQLSRQLLSIPAVSLIILATLAVAGSPMAEAATQPLACSPSTLGFGAIPVGSSEAQLVVLTNQGQTSATVSAISVSSSDFTVSGLNLPVTLAAGEKIGLTVTFTPTTTGRSDETVTFTSGSSNPSLQLVVGGSGLKSEAVTAAPSSLSFGQVAVGSTATLSVVLTNVRQWSRTLSAIQAMGSAFSVSAPTLPVVMTPGQTVKLSITFTPRATGVTSGSVFYYYGERVNIPLTGTGTSTTTGQLSLSPTSINFGDVEVGSTTTDGSTLSAVGGSVTISSASSNNSQFAIAGTTFPITINAGQSVQMKVTFTPKTASSASASLTFVSNASDPTVLETLTGTGSAPIVTLSWSPSTSQVSGYNIYRGTSPGSYSKLNSTLDSGITYSDSTVASGTTYYYSATAVNSSGQESGYSAPVQVAVP